MVRLPMKSALPEALSAAAKADINASQISTATPTKPSLVLTLSTSL